MKWTLSSEQMTSLAWCMLLAFAALMLPVDVWAANIGIQIGTNGGGAGGEPQGITGVLCTVVGWFQGSIGKAIATLAIIVVGIGALMGKVSWGMAIIVGLGVGVVFGASNIVDVLGGKGSC